MPLTVAAAAQAEQPLSAIEWLSNPQAQQSTLPENYELPSKPEQNTSIQTIEITELGEDPTTGIGLLPLHVAGLPADVWSNADADKIDRQIAQLPLGMLPTASDLLDRLLLAQAKSNDEILCRDRHWRRS